MKPNIKRAIFFDRDGVIIENRKVKSIHPYLLGSLKT